MTSSFGAKNNNIYDNIQGLKYAHVNGLPCGETGEFVRCKAQQGADCGGFVLPERVPGMAFFLELEPWLCSRPWKTEQQAVRRFPGAVSVCRPLPRRLQLMGFNERF